MCSFLLHHSFNILHSADAQILQRSWFVQSEPWFCFLNVAQSPHLSVAPASCLERTRYCGPGYQPSAAVGAHPQRWAMTETAGPQGGPPPSAGRGLWSEAFKGEMRGGAGVGGGRQNWAGVNTAVSSDTRKPAVKFKCKHLKREFCPDKVRLTLMRLNVEKQRRVDR